MIHYQNVLIIMEQHCNLLIGAKSRRKKTKKWFSFFTKFLKCNLGMHNL